LRHSLPFTFDKASEFHARGYVELVERVANVRLDGLCAQKQFRCDVPVCLSVRDELGYLTFAAGKCCEGGAVVRCRC
jgi:hypothetical protein